MENQKLKAIFAEVLRLPEPAVNDDLRYNETANWDSVAHMALIAAIEEGFDILIETDDVINMSSFGKAKEIVARYSA